MKDPLVKIVGKLPPLSRKEAYTKYYRTYFQNRFNQLDSLLRQEGYYCINLCDLESTRCTFAQTGYFLKQLEERKRETFPQRIIIPAKLVLTRGSFVKLGSEFNHNPEEYYAIYTHLTNKHKRR